MSSGVFHMNARLKCSIFGVVLEGLPGSIKGKHMDKDAYRFFILRRWMQ